MVLVVKSEMSTQGRSLGEGSILSGFSEKKEEPKGIRLERVECDEDSDKGTVNSSIEQKTEH